MKLKVYVNLQKSKILKNDNNRKYNIFYQKYLF